MVYKNKKAYFDYEILSTYTCGISLKGYEAKCLDMSGGDINASYCKFDNKDNFILINTKIEITSNVYRNNLEILSPNRDRFLLLKKNELRKIREQLEVKGLTCVPLKMYRNERYLWKIDIGIVRPLKKYDKREKIKKRDLERVE